MSEIYITVVPGNTVTERVIERVIYQPSPTSERRNEVFVQSSNPQLHPRTPIDKTTYGRGLTSGIQPPSPQQNPALLRSPTSTTTTTTTVTKHVKRSGEPSVHSASSPVAVNSSFSNIEREVGMQTPPPSSEKRSQFRQSSEKKVTNTFSSPRSPGLPALNTMYSNRYSEDSPSHKEFLNRSFNYIQARTGVQQGEENQELNRASPLVSSPLTRRSPITTTSPQRRTRGSGSPTKNGDSFLNESTEHSATNTTTTTTLNRSIKRETTEIRFESGGRYVGEHENGVMNGTGIYYYPNGSKYNGMWLNGKKHGQGRLDYADGSVYQGDWSNDERHGFGVYTTNHYKYEGTWSHDQKHGKGLIVYSNAEQYEGEWVSNYPQGIGEYLFKDGSKYLGMFHKGLRHGKGSLQYGDGCTIYEGDWVQDKKHGKAVITFINGTYEGEIRSDVKEGYGVYKYNNGDCYEGGWVNNKKHGTGLYYFAEGGSYRGTWVAGSKQGEGILETADGTKYQETWSQGKLISKARTNSL